MASLSLLLSHQYGDCNSENSSNCPNNSTSNRNFDDLLKVVLKYTNFFHFLMMTYSDTLCSIISIFTNFFVLAIFMNKSAASKVGKTVRFYYVLIAISDIVCVLDIRLIFSFSYLGLEWATKGKYFLWMIKYHSIYCKIILYIYNVSEQISGFALVLFSLERVIVIYFPFASRTLITYTKVIMINAVVHMIIFIFNVHLLYATIVIPTVVEYYMCLPEGNIEIFESLYWYTMGFQNYGLPTIFVIILDIFLVSKLMKEARYTKEHLHRNTRATLECDAQSTYVTSKKEKLATISLAVIAAAHAIIYLPAAITNGLIAPLSIGILKKNPLLYGTAQEIGFVCIHIATFAKAASFCVFYFKVPYFRKHFNAYTCFIFCGLCREVNLDVTSKTSTSISKSNVHTTISPL